MGLYERLIGQDDNGHVVEDRIVPEVFAVVASEYARGALAGGSVGVLLDGLGITLNDDEQDEVATLLSTIIGTDEEKAVVALEIRDVLFIARQRAPGYATPTEVRTRLGV